VSDLTISFEIVSDGDLIIVLRPFMIIVPGDNREMLAAFLLRGQVGKAILDAMPRKASRLEDLEDSDVG